MTIPAKLPFDEVNKHARAHYLPILERWLPGGKVVGGKEYVVLNPKRADTHIKSFSINIKTGQWGDFATQDVGGDPVSLYAYLNCGGTDKQARNEACRLMAAEFGLTDDTPRPKGRPKLKVVPKEEPDPWQPGIPPDDAEPAPIKGWDHVFVYRDRAGRLLRYVVRNDARDGKAKEVWPMTYGWLKSDKYPNGKTGWHRKHPASPRCLYGLERLDGRPVLLQEGEKKTDQVQALLDGYACLSLTQGSSGVEHNDLSPLAGMVVTYCPDNDEPGRKAALAVSSKLLALGCTVRIVDTQGQADKWDLGDAVEDGWTADRIKDFLKDNAHDFTRDPGNPDPEPEASDDDEWKDDGPDSVGGVHEGIVPLGHDKNIHYYLSRSSGQVVGLTPARHVELELIGLADPDTYWYKLKALEKEDGGVNWKKAAAWLMRWSKKQGIYKPDRIRGRGAWLDQGRAVLHLGESLIVEGIWQKSLSLPGNPPFVYEAAGCLGLTVAPALRNADAHKLLKMCELLRWEKDISAVLAAGWIAIAPICGVLLWRPSIWITGSSNSGKTTFLKDIIAPVLGRGLDDGIAVNAQSKTTEAGIRQMLGSDARPVIFDEAEAEMLNDKTRMQAVIDLNRQSSSEGGAEIIKGTQNQSGAKRYRIRSCFLYSSINVALDHLADESRITVLDLYNPGPAEMERDRQRWAQLQALMAETVTDPLWCAGMVARSVLLMKTIRANAAIFKLAVAEAMNSSRVGDQLGTLLAGAYSLHSDREITLDEARAYVARHDWASATSAEAVKDEQRLLSHLIQQRVRIDLGDNKTMERTVSEAIAIAHDEAGAVSEVTQAALKRCGIKLEGEGVWFSNTHNMLKGWLKDTPWSSQWGRSLKRLPGAKSSDKQTIDFGKYDKTKAVWLPLAALEG